MSKLYIVATPIGNLEDITLRALRVLREVDFILAESPKKSLRLLNFYHIRKPILKFHQHTRENEIEKILNLLREGKNLAFISEAGTPGISDPGGKLVEKVREKFGEEIQIIPIPGPSALTCIISVSGFPTDRFLFLGFLPKKKKRKEFFEKILNSEFPVIFFEAPYRILNTLEELKNLNPQFQVVVGRELTKKFETIYWGSIEEVIKKVKKNKIKGEFVVIVFKKIRKK